MAKTIPKPNPLFPTADSLEDALQRAKSTLRLHSPNEVHAAVMIYHNTLLASVIKGLEAAASDLKNQ